MFSKIKSWFTEPHLTQHQITPRHVRRTGEVVEATTAETETVKLKKWVKSTLGTAPWAALAIILFALFAHGAVASGALMYGLLKMAIAVLATVIADETMFNGLSQPQEGWVPMIRRSAVFLGICWVLAVT
jgi:hypothetical protein